MAGIGSSKFSEEEKTLLKSLIKGKKRAIIDSKKKDAYLSRKQKEAWSEVTSAFNAAGLGRVRTMSQLKSLWGNPSSRLKKVHKLQTHGSQDACRITQAVELTQDLVDRSSLPLQNYGDDSGHDFNAGTAVAPGFGEHADTKTNIPVQSGTADGELTATNSGFDNDVKENIIPSHPADRALWEAQLKVLEMQAKVEDAQFKRLERQARIEEAQLKSAERLAKIEAHLKSLERQAKIDETQLKNLERQASIEESELKILQRQSEIEEAKARILERQVEIDAQSKSTRA
ncbi:uncharacterized protein LOC122252778 [Penaeus japonicus]|uniref:uncharacterized protein LOC122252778 n=1 Tax=Penaeus japonicus TaxID=27405 RepID=UPI001C70EFA8|nr:uncharacterized protein LOC122252778 [Penaeus japonicus]